MTATLQEPPPGGPVLFGQPSLFDSTTPSLSPLADAVRTPLDSRCWIERLGPWLVGAESLFAELHHALEWQQGVRPMYDRIVEVPRLIAAIEPGQNALVCQMRAALAGHYGVTFDSATASLYRHGSDSVAWHSDRIGQTQRNPLVIIVSLGAPRDLLMRPVGGGASTPITMGSGDLLVMGGATQHRWEHCVPKRAHAGPRMSITFRHSREPLLPGESYRPA